VSHPRQADLQGLLRALLGGGVEFIVVGGVAAVFHGAPTTTVDLDIVHRRTTENVARLLATLETLDARVRDPSGRILRPEAAALLGRGQVNLSTMLGPLDPLCVLHDGRGYEELLERSIELRDDTLRVRVLDLPTLIEVKRSTGRARDRLVLPILLALLDEAD
jgi:hypothetical protein